MNVYEKLQKARVELQSLNLKKTGNNKFAGYQYYELADFLPSINKIMLDLKLSSYVKFTQDLAILHIVNSETTDEIIEFTSTIADAQLKGCHPVQNLGAVQTYIRRYLYTNAFEIVESDALDLTTGKEDKKQQSKTETKTDKPQQTESTQLNEAQIKRLYAKAYQKGYMDQDVKKAAFSKFGVNELKKLTKEQYDIMCNGYDKAEPKKQGGV